MQIILLEFFQKCVHHFTKHDLNSIINEKFCKKIENAMFYFFYGNKNRNICLRRTTTTIIKTILIDVVNETCFQKNILLASKFSTMNHFPYPVGFWRNNKKKKKNKLHYLFLDIPIVLKYYLFTIVIIDLTFGVKLKYYNTHTHT